MNRQFDLVVIGSGLAGLSVALDAAEHRRVAVICKGEVSDGASDHAQGGIAAVLAAEDDFDRHVADTLEAGAGLCDAGATRIIIEDGPASIAWLAAQGVRFTRDDESALAYHLTCEGGHSRRRIVHAADATGHEVHWVLAQRSRRHPNITLLEGQVAIDLVVSVPLGKQAPRCDGVYVLDVASGRVHPIAASHTVLATGGAGALYLHTSNPPTSTGDGIAMAWRAGCRLANLEFIQFHPTCLHHPQGRSFLISEAVRGEGGILRLPPAAGDAAGVRFMPFHDPRAELAPRDIVARAIEHEMRTRRLDCVHLDITARPAHFVKSHFPTIHGRCLALGIDMTRDPIPVVPAAHYTCGGVVTGPAARTGLGGLYAVGEVACTGLHGANRLASNSLLECVTTGRAAARDIVQQPTSAVRAPARWTGPRVATTIEPLAIAPIWECLRSTMWNDVGITRTTKGLKRARRCIRHWREDLDRAYPHSAISAELLALRNALTVASLIVASALTRRESRGAHFNRDHPRADVRARPTVLTPAMRGSPEVRTLRPPPAETL
jgi:L-aspartate oxidase